MHSVIAYFCRRLWEGVIFTEVGGLLGHQHEGHEGGPLHRAGDARASRRNLRPCSHRDGHSGFDKLLGVAESRAAVGRSIRPLFPTLDSLASSLPIQGHIELFEKHVVNCFLR